MQGRLYTWGRGFVGQLGLGHRLDDDVEHVQELPTICKFVKAAADGSELAQRVVCGHCHTVLQTGLAGARERERQRERVILLLCVYLSCICGCYIYIC